MYVDRSRNVYTDASYADRERFSLSRRRVCAYVREKKKKKEKMQCRTWPMVHCSLKQTMTVCGSFESRR